MRWPAMLTLLLSTAAWAQATAPNPTGPADLPTLVRQLASPDFSTRTRAQILLEQLDPSAVGPLEKLATSEKDPEVKTRLAAAVLRLQDDAALLPTPVSWDLRDATRAQVVAAIEKASGRKIDVREETGPDALPIPELTTCHVANKPFWQAMVTLSEAAGFTVEYQTGAIGLVFGRKSDLSTLQTRGGFAWISQPWLYPGLQQAGFLHMPITCLVDPRIKVIGHSEITLTSGVDDRGESLLDRPTIGQSNLGNPRVLYSMPVLPLRRGEGHAVTLRGAERFWVATREERAQIELDSNVTHHLAGQEMRVFITQQSGNLRGTFNFKRLPAAPEHLLAEFIIQDAAGKELDRTEVGDPPSMAVDFPREYPPGSRYLLVVTAREKTIEVPFEFKNLPLPGAPAP